MEKNISYDELLYDVHQKLDAEGVEALDYEDVAELRSLINRLLHAKSEEADVLGNLYLKGLYHKFGISGDNAQQLYDESRHAKNVLDIIISLFD